MEDNTIKDWLISLDIPGTVAGDIQSILHGQGYNNLSDLRMDFPSETSLNNWGILGRWATRMKNNIQPSTGLISRTSPKASSSLAEQLKGAWHYTIFVNIEEAECTGIILQSFTNSNNRHLLLNLHSFQQEGKQCHLAIPGFPKGYENEFYDLAGKTRPKKKPKIPEQQDPLKISLKKVSHITTEGTYAETLKTIFTAPLSKKDILYCSGDRDVIVIFDAPIPETEVAPVSFRLSLHERVHLCGFSILDKAIGPQSFAIGGEIVGAIENKLSLSCMSSPGLSGGAVVMDDDGGVIAYLGGGYDASDGSFFGSYAYTISHVFEVIKETDRKILLKATEEQKQKEKEEEEEEEEEEE